MKLDEAFILPECIRTNEKDFFKQEEDVVMFQYSRFLPPVCYSHSFFEIIYVAKGSCLNYMEQRDIPLEAGDVCILAPRNTHTIHCCSEKAIIYSILVRASTFETTFFNVISDRDILSRFFSRTLRGRQNNGYMLFRPGIDAQIQTFIGFLYQEYQANDDYKNRMMVNILNGFFILLLRHHNQHVVISQTDPMQREDELFAILNYIQTNYTDLTIERLSTHFGFSARHMARLVKKGAGMSFGELVRATKLHRAAVLLETSAYSIDEIAQQAGYADLSGFHRAFKRHYGISPSEYRQKISPENVTR